MLVRVAPGVAAAGFVVVLAFHSGGYYASEWGLVAFAFLLATVMVLVLADRVTTDRRRMAMLSALVALMLWQSLSVLWSTGAGVPVLEAERTLLYVAAAAALLLSVTRAMVPSLVGGLVAGVTVVALYALATRLSPGTVGGAYDPSSGYQLAKPIGYANALGLLVAVGAILAVGLALRGPFAANGVAGAALVPLIATLYFTFSRGAIATIVVAFAVLVAFERQRLRTSAELAALLAAPALGVLIASGSRALTTPGATLQTARAEGHRLAWQLAVLTVAAAAAATAVRVVGRRVSLRPRPARLVAFGATAVAVAAAGAGIASADGPRPLVDHIARGFTVPQPAPAAPGTSARLLSVRSNGRADYWRVAARMVHRHPLLGDGAGSFAARWTQQRPVADDQTRNAHNLYLETLAELGPVGLTVLLVALVAPLTAVRTRRAGALAPTLAAAYAAFLVHAATDWDWEIPLLTVVALACGASIVAVAEVRTVVRTLTPALRGAGLAVAAALIFCALVAHVGNRAAADGLDALRRGDTRAAAADARRAQAWMPWSSQPWQLVGEAQFAEGARRAAVVSLRRAASLDDGQWSIWLDLAVAERGGAASSALARARKLNPLGIGDVHEVTVTAGVAIRKRGSYHRRRRRTPAATGRTQEEHEGESDRSHARGRHRRRGRIGGVRPPRRRSACPLGDQE
jgi:hypothetical protein